MEIKQESWELIHYSYSYQPMPLSMLRAIDEKKVSPIRNRKPKEESDYEEQKELLYCTFCLKLITSGDQRIQVEGSHEHQFINPAGVAFNLGCFGDVPGAVFQGIPTEEFTWFKGYQWRMAHCSKCLTHIGWQYRHGEQGSFSGLILTRLTT